jgi:hypothetical protein
MGAHLDMQVFAIGGAGGKCVTTTADHLDFFIFRMNFRFHWVMPGQNTLFTGAGSLVQTRKISNELLATRKIDKWPEIPVGC